MNNTSGGTGDTVVGTVDFLLSRFEILCCLHSFVLISFVLFCFVLFFLKFKKKSCMTREKSRRRETAVHIESHQPSLRSKAPIAVPSYLCYPALITTCILSFFFYSTGLQMRWQKAKISRGLLRSVDINAHLLLELMSSP